MAKILVTDDDPTARTVAKRVIENLGHEVVTAADGSEALAHLGQDSEIRVIVIDYQMPGKGGREVIEELVAAGRFLPTIIVSGVITVHEIADLLDAGADFFLPKPYDHGDLARYVASCLAKDTAHTSGAHRIADAARQMRKRDAQAR